MNAPPKNAQYDLLTLHKQFPGANNISQFCDSIHQLDLDKLTAAYATLRKTAPRRHHRGKKYFVGHDGAGGGEKNSNRGEEHLAMALWNDFATATAAEGRFLFPTKSALPPLLPWMAWMSRAHPAHERPMAVAPAMSRLRLLDYQFPLKARRDDAGIGKVDLFAAIDDEFACVIELKVDGDASRGDTPLYAWIEALGYCAMVDANINDIAAEAKSKFGLHFATAPPRLMVMAPESYWDGYRRHPKAGRWQPALQNLADDIAARIGVQSYFVSLRNAKFSMGGTGVKPRLGGECFLEFALTV